MENIENILFNCNRKYYKKTYLTFYDRNGDKYTVISDYDCENDYYKYSMSKDGTPFLNKEKDIIKYMEKLENEEEI